MRTMIDVERKIVLAEFTNLLDSYLKNSDKSDAVRTLILNKLNTESCSYIRSCYKQLQSCKSQEQFDKYDPLLWGIKDSLQNLLTQTNT